MRSSYVLSSLVLLAAAVLAQDVPAYNQCDGKTYTGSKTCVSGYTCTFVSEWYSQCRPITVISSAPVTTTTKTTTTTTTTKTTTTTTTTTSIRSVGPTTTVNPSVIVNLTPATKYQTVDGFGGINLGSNWDDVALSTTVINSAFTELGLSILRVRIPPNNSQWSKLVASVKEAIKVNPNVKVFASIWSPPANLKTNNNVISGSLSTSQYNAYADFLQSFVDFMKTNGIPLYAVAIQNEPDIKVTYESCDWTAQQVLSFVKNQRSRITGTKLMTAESFQFNRGYYDPILNDATAVQNIDIVAGHIYGGGLSAYPLATQKGKPIWMTEHLLNSNVGWAETMQMAQEVNDCMNAGWSAYVWWYIQRFYSFIGDGSNGTASGAVLPRGYVFSHFAKYVLPGYVRIGGSSNNANIKFSSFTGDNKIATVLINTGSSAVTLGLTYGKAVSVEAAVSTTQSTGKPAALSTAMNGNTVVLTIPASSIATVVVV